MTNFHLERYSDLTGTMAETMELGSQHETIYPDILHFLEAAGLMKTAKRFRKETGCTMLPEVPVSLVDSVHRTRKRYNKKVLSRSGKCGVQAAEISRPSNKNNNKGFSQLKKEVADVVKQLGFEKINNHTRNGSCQRKDTRDLPCKEDAQSAASTDIPHDGSDSNEMRNHVTNKGRRSSKMEQHHSELQLHLAVIPSQEPVASRQELCFHIRTNRWGVTNGQNFH